MTNQPIWLAVLLRAEGWHTNHKRVERIWRAEGLRVPPRQPKACTLVAERRLMRAAAAGAAEPGVGGAGQGSGGKADGMPAEGYDLVENRPRDGRKLRMLNVVDEFTRKCLAIRDARRLKSAGVIDVLADLFIMRGSPWGETRLASSQGLDDRVERLRRELQRQAQGRTAGLRGVQQPG